MFFNKIDLENFSKDIYLDVLWGNDKVHYVLNKVMGYFIQDLHSNNFTFINISHINLPSNELSFVNDLLLNEFNKIVTLDKKSLTHFFDSPKILDLQISNGEHYEITTPNLSNIHKKFHNYKSLNNYISLSIHVQRFQTTYQNISSEINISKLESSAFKEDFNKAFYLTEICPVNVSIPILDIHYPKHEKSLNIEHMGLQMTYNLCNPSLRPTMTRYGMNLLNVPKNSQLRELIFSSNGYIFNYDYKGFHLSILCKLLKYDLDGKDVYTTLYNDIHKTNFKKITELQYEDVKKYFFTIFFSETLESEHDSNLLKKVMVFKKYLLKDFQQNGFIKSPFTKEKYWHKSYTDKNIFSIFFRICETELNVKTLLNVHDILKGKLTKLVLYQFDSFIFDWNKNDGKQILKDLQRVIKTQDEYAVSISYGNDLGHLNPL